MVGVVVPTDKVDSKSLMSTVKQLIGSNVPFAFVLTGPDSPPLDKQRLAHFNYFITTNPDGDYNRSALGVIQATGASRSNVHASDAALDNLGSHQMHNALGFVETQRVVYFRKVLD